MLASDIPPHQQLIGEERGLLFKTGDIESCVRCLDWAINHTAEMLARARNAQRYVKANYNWNHITSETLKLYTTVCNSSDTFGTQVPRSNTYALASGSINYANTKPLYSYLLEAGLVTEENINHALAEQQVTGMPLRAILVQQGLIKEKTIEYLMEKVILPEKELAKGSLFFNPRLRQKV